MSGIRNKPLLLLITFGERTHDSVGKKCNDGAHHDITDNGNTYACKEKITKGIHFSSAIQEYDTDHILISVFDITVIMNKTVNFFTV